MRVLVIGATKGSGEETKENYRKRPFIQKVAWHIGRALARHDAEPICMTTLGGGIDPDVCKGFHSGLAAAGGIDRIDNRLWVYPPSAQPFYDGPGRRKEINHLRVFEESNALPQIRARLVISQMAAEADATIAVRGGKGIEFAFIISIVRRTKFVCIPILGGKSAQVYDIYNLLPEVTAPVFGLSEFPWDEVQEYEDLAERMAAATVECALESPRQTSSSHIG